jgi:Mg2+ and Co2+ transporter CorA
MINIELDEDQIKAKIEKIVNDVAKEVAGVDIQGHENIEEYLNAIYYSISSLNNEIAGYKESVDKYTVLVEGIIKQEADPHFILDIMKEISYIKKENLRIENDMNEIRKLTGVGNVFE